MSPKMPPPQDYAVAGAVLYVQGVAVGWASD